MIISCQKCNKRFEIDGSLIPNNGRLLKCGSCEYEWFFTREIIERINPESDQINIDETKSISSGISTSVKNKEIEISPNKIENEELEIEISPNKIENEELEIETDILVNDLKVDQSKKTKKKKLNFFNILIVFIISIASFILIVDTFKEQISVIIPNIEFILYNLYEVLKDIKLFFKDLY
jgi:predicted Zn finger-like uncharacterized protein